MAEPDISAFIDSNIFLQCRDIKDLAWHSVLGVTGWVEIVISPAIIGELDKKKIDRNPRLRTRSRAALAQIEQASTFADERIELKASPRLTLRVAHLPPPDWAQTPTLNHASVDDTLVAHALGHAGPAALVSHDTGPRLSARRYQMRAVSPPDDWLLPDQPDEAEQEIQKLKREVLELRNQRPAIVASFAIGGSEVKGLHRIVLPILEPLPKPVIDALLTRHLTRFPEANLQVPDGPVSMRAVAAIKLGYTAEDARLYSKAYAAYVAEVGSYYADLHKTIAWSAKQLAPELVLENTSGNTGDRLLISMRVTPDLRLLDNGDDLFGLAPPVPPEPPKVRSPFGEPLGVSLIPKLHLNQHRNPTGFYWQMRPDGDCSVASRICEEFRAKARYSLEMDMVTRGEGRHTISVDISASNMPAPIAASLVLDITSQRMGWHQAIDLVELDTEVAADIRAVVPA